MSGHGLEAVADVHLLADVFDVGPHGFQADTQLVTDLFVDVAGGEQIEDFLFPR